MSISADMIAIFNQPENQFIWNFFGLDFIPEHVIGINMFIFIIISCFICFVPDNNCRKKDVLSPASLAMASVAFVLGVLCLGTESVFVYSGF